MLNLKVSIIRKNANKYIEYLFTGLWKMNVEQYIIIRIHYWPNDLGQAVVTNSFGADDYHPWGVQTL